MGITLPQSLRRENAALRDKVVPLTVLRHAITVEKELTATLQVGHGWGR